MISYVILVTLPFSAACCLYQSSIFHMMYWMKSLKVDWMLWYCISKQQAAHSTQHTAHSTQHTAHSTQHTAHSTQHTAHSTQHTAHSTQHTAHSTQHTAGFVLTHHAEKREDRSDGYWMDICSNGVAKIFKLPLRINTIIEQLELTIEPLHCRVVVPVLFVRLREESNQLPMTWSDLFCTRCPTSTRAEQFRT
jgi:hypothetical protein